MLAMLRLSLFILWFEVGGINGNYHEISEIKEIAENCLKF